MPEMKVSPSSKQTSCQIQGPAGCNAMTVISIDLFKRADCADKYILYLAARKITDAAPPHPCRLPPCTDLFTCLYLALI